MVDTDIVTCDVRVRWWRWPGAGPRSQCDDPSLANTRLISHLVMITLIISSTPQLSGAGVCLSVSVVRDCQLWSRFPTLDSPSSQQCSWVRRSGCLLIIETKYDSYNFPNKRIADAALAPLMSCTIFYFAQLRLQHDWEQNLLIALNGFLENLK